MNTFATVTRCFNYHASVKCQLFELCRATLRKFEEA